MPPGHDVHGSVERTQPEPIFHIARRAEWEGCGGDYRISTLGMTLDDVGFIHCSTAAQVAAVANAFYRGEDDLVVLTIDPGRVGADVRFENTVGGTELFPHVYGSLPAAAVVAVAPLRPGKDGRFEFDG